MYNVSQEFLTKIKEPSRLTKGSVGIGNIGITNSVPNGDFSDSTSYWSTNGTTLSVLNNELLVEPTSFTEAVGVYTSPPNSVIGNKYYCNIKFFPNASNDIKIGWNDSRETIPTTMNIWNTVSLISTRISSSAFVFYHDASSGYTTGDVFKIKEVAIIDLTATYGAGNEPSKEYMDELISKVGWFDGIGNVPTSFSGDRVLNNVMLNGDFSDGSLWSYSGTNGTQLDNKVSLITDTSSGEHYMQQDISYGLRAEDIYYYSCYADNFINSKVILNIYNRRISNSYEHSTSSIVESDGYVSLSYTLTDISATSPNIIFRPQLMSVSPTSTIFTGTTEQVDISKCIVINLTDMYGKGNEPSKEDMDLLIQSSDWFNYKTFSSIETNELDTLVDFSLQSSFGTNDMPTLGGVVSSGMSLTMVKDSRLPQILIGIPIRPYTAIDIGGGVYEWVKHGEFYANQDDITKNKKTITIDSLDMMASYDDLRYDTLLSYPNTIQNMLVELTSTYGLSFVSQTLPSVEFDIAPKGTVRQVLGMIASLCTTNAVINTEGKVEFKFLTTSGFAFDANNYVDFKLTSDNSIKISQLTIPTDEDATEIVAGDGTGFALKFENSAIQTSANLQVLFDREFPLEYYSYTMIAQGMPHLQVGDYVEFTDVDLNVRTLAILNHTFSYNGGMKSVFKVDAPKENTTDIILTGGSTLDKAIARSYETLVMAVANASSLITGNQGGTVITILDETTGQPTELVICDTGDINTATNVWRWNLSGLGFSSTGYNDTYRMALTIDGHFNAEFIDTGTLTASLITTDVLRSANGVSEMDMDNGTFNFGSGKLVFDGTDFVINYEGTNLQGDLDGKASSDELDNLTSFVRIGGNGITLGEVANPFQITINNTSMQFIDNGSIPQAEISNIIGDGTIVTAFFEEQAYIPFPVGSTIVVENVPTTSYNGTWIVTEGNTTDCSWEDTTTPIDNGGIIKSSFVKDENAVAYINQRTMYIENLQATESLIVGVHKIEKYNSDITLIKWIG